MVAHVRDVLSAVISYDPDTGVFRWRHDTKNRIKDGSVVGYVNREGYRELCYKKKNYRLHRVAWLFISGEWPNGEIDHINGDRDDNRINNLRDCTRAQNAQNMKTHKDNKSGVKGAWLDKNDGKWKSSIAVNGKLIYLGSFKYGWEAHQAYRAASSRYHGEFGRV